MTIQLKRNDTKDTISYALKNSDGTVVNLTGATVRFVMGKKDVLITDSPATIVNATQGTVEYTLTDSDTLSAGTFMAEFEVTFSDGRVKTYPNSGYILVDIQYNIDKNKSTYVEDAIALRVSDIQVFKDEVNAKVDQAVEDAEKVNLMQAQIDQLVIEGDSSVEAAQARVKADGTSYTTLRERLNSVDSQLAERATKDELNALGQLKLDGTYDTLSALQTAKPTGATGLYLVIADGYTYRWNSSAWVQAVQFQSTGIADGTVTLDKMYNSELITDYVVGETTSPLPLKTAGKYEVALAEKGDLFIGNGNLIDIVNMTDGTYQANGLTVTVAKNRITIAGSPTVAQYFRLSGVTGYVPNSSGLNVKSYPLPISDTYTFGVYSIVNTSSPAFSISIRSTVSGNYAQVALTDSSPYDQNLNDLTKFGEVYMYFPAGTYDCAFSLFLMPTAYDVNNTVTPNTSKFTNVSKARVESTKGIYSTKAGTTRNLVNIYEKLNTQQPAPVVTQQTNQILVESHKTYFNFYIKGTNKDSNKYLRYKFEYWDGTGINNGKGWVLGVVDAVENNNGTWTVLYPVVTAGEWEMALRILGRIDFIGCKQHGSEVNFYEKFYIDGVNWTPNESTFYCKEIKIIEKSNMFDPADEVTQVGKHRKDYTITTDSINIKQRVEWSAALTMGKDSYFAMLPILRGNDATTTYQITAFAYNDDTYEEINVSSGSHSGRTELHNPNKWTLFSNSTGISASVENKPKVKTDGAYSFVQNTVDKYNKIYFGYCGDSFPVAIGDVWENEVIYKLNISA